MCLSTSDPTNVGSSRPTRLTPDIAYRKLANQLRNDIFERRFQEGDQLPTEAELASNTGLSRQTIRRALQDLVAEGLVQRVRGRGTFVSVDSGKYLRQLGSIEDLLAIGVDTELEIIDPPRFQFIPEAAGRLGLDVDTDHVVALRFRRFHNELPFAVTDAFLPPKLGNRLLDIRSLLTPRIRQRMTLLSVVQSILGGPIVGAEQTITAELASPLHEEIDCGVGQPVLRIDRLYRDFDGSLIELAINYLNPQRFSYRFTMGTVVPNPE
jgi:GntR family transcriptional regulator